MTTAEAPARGTDEAALAVVRELLGDGPLPGREVKRQAAEAGVTGASLNRATDALGVVKTSGTGGRWTLPEHVPEPPPPGHGRCNRCSAVKPLDDFPRCRKTRSGR